MPSENSTDIKILMLTASLPPLSAGGAEIQALKLGQALSKKGIAVSFITPGKRGLKEAALIHDMPVYRLHSFLNSLFELFSGFKKRKQKIIPRIEYDDSKELTSQINRKISWPTVLYYNIFFFQCLFFLWRRRKSFDIIHAHTMEWSAIVATRLGKFFKKPVLIKESTMNGFQSLSRFPSGKNLQKMISDNAHFIAMTKIINENLSKAGVPAERITRIPNGIVITGKSIRGIDKGSPTKTLFVGNLYQQPAKGVDILLKAWRVVHQQFPQALLEIIGDGVTTGYQDFIDHLKIDKVVRLLGKRPDLDKYYAAADIFVLPSRREGMSNALMEAMLYELPCVATDISGNQDLIISGTNGLLVPAMDVDSLAAGICYMLSNPLKAIEMGKNARETILQKTDIDIIADKYILLYGRLLVEGTRPRRK